MENETERTRIMSTTTATDIRPLDVVFDGPPSHEAPRFIEVEDMDGKSVSVGDWIDREDGTWALRLWVAE